MIGSVRYDICNNPRLLIEFVSFYHALHKIFTVKQGVSPKDASYFVGRSYLSMVQDAERDCEDPKRFDALVEEQTPGGLNEQVSVWYMHRFTCGV